MAATMSIPTMRLLLVHMGSVTLQRRDAGTARFLRQAIRADTAVAVQLCTPWAYSEGAKRNAVRAATAQRGAAGLNQSSRAKLDSLVQPRPLL